MSPAIPQPAFIVDFETGESTLPNGFQMMNGASIKDGAPGIVSKALRIDSDGPYVVLPGVDISPSKMPEVSMRIEFFLESIPEGAKGWLLNHDNGGYDRSLALHDERFGGICHGVGYPAGPSYDTYTVPEVGKWVQMVVTYRQGGECAIFVSNEKAPITHVGRNNNGQSSLILGRVMKYKNHWCDCWIKGVSVYDKALSDEEVDAIFGKFKEEIVVPSGEASDDESVDQGEDDESVDQGEDSVVEPTTPYEKPLSAVEGKWQSISGNLRQVCVSASGKHIFGIGGEHSKVWYKPGPKGSWKSIGKEMIEVSSSAGGDHVWGCDENDDTWYRNGAVDAEWKQIKGRLRSVCVSADGNHIWGIGGNDKRVWYKNGINGAWKLIGGTMKQLSCSASGGHIWGTDTSNKVWYRAGITGEWRQITGTLKHVSVSADGKHVWGVSHKEDVWYRTGPERGNWKKIDGDKKLMQLCVSADGNHVWGVTSGHKVWYRSCPEINCIIACPDM